MQPSKTSDGMIGMKTQKLGTASVTMAVALAVAAIASAADRHVPATFPTIQAAVNAASNGDTIQIAPGVYPGQTRISGKRLTLIGQPGTILRAAPGMTRLLGDFPGLAVIGIRSHSDVAIRGLTFEGERLAMSGGDILFGVLNVDSAGSVENCRFTGFRGAPTGSGQGIAITFLNDLDDAALVQVRVVGNTVADCNGGMGLSGAYSTPRRPSVDFTITDNTFTGIGPSADAGNIFVSGIQIALGATGLVKNNTISGYSFSGFPGLATGIEAQDRTGIWRGEFQPMEPIVFEGNTLRDNQVHLFMIKGNGNIITNNTFKGRGGTLGITPDGADVTGGLALTGTNVVIANNRFVDMERGILLQDHNFAPNPPADIGSAIDVVLTGNRFCDVANPVQREPEANATETGTLLCPFPDPVLKIASAVLLSWPEIEKGFVVESAPTVDGPWTLSDATPFVHAGQTRVSVTTTSNQLFLRLHKP